MKQQSRATLDQLLSEADWLNGLAIHLVRDPSAADDVVQRTWLTALRGTRDCSRSLPDGGREARRGWLARVASHVAGHQHRESSRRGRRSALALEAREEGGEVSPLEISSRLETQRLVAEALIRLPEPIRACVYLRYYAGLRPQDIASELALNPGTVRSRLHRGREMLRNELTQDGRDWSQWCQALAPFTLAAARQAKPGLAGLGSSAPPMAVAGAGVLTLGLAALWQGGPGLAASAHGANASPPVAVDLAVETAAGPALAAGPAEVAFGPQVARRTMVDGQDAAKSPVLLTGTVRSKDGQPVGGAQIALQGPTRDFSVQSASNGAWSLPTGEPGPWRIRVQSPWHRSVWVDAEVPAAKAHQLDLLLEALPKVAVRFEDPKGRVIQGDVDKCPRSMRVLERLDRSKSHIASMTDSMNERTFYPSVIATRHAPGERLHGLEAGRLTSYGQGKWLEPGKFQSAKIFPRGVQGLLLLDTEDSAWISLVYGDRVLESRFFEELPPELTFAVDQSQLKSLHGTLTFAVKDSRTQRDISKEFLRPFPRVWLDSMGVQLLGHEDGQFRIFDVPPGPHRVQVWGQRSGYEEVLWSVSVSPGEDVVLRPAERRATAPIQVSVSSADGDPLAATVWAARDSGSDLATLNWGLPAKAGDGGLAKVTSAAEGRVYLRIHVQGSNLWLGRVIDSSETKRVEVTTASHCRIRLRKGAERFADRYTLWDSAGFPLLSNSLLRKEISLEPGVYFIQRHTDGGLGPKRECIVSGSSTVLDLAGI